MDSSKKQRILIIMPGPKYNIVDEFEERMSFLSGRYEGVLLSFGPKPQKETFKSFDVDILGIPHDASTFSKFKQLDAAARKYAKDTDLIITYDPLLCGLVGARVAKRYKSKLLVEVNGIYDDPLNYCDMESWLFSTIKRHLYTRVLKYVLSKAHGIRLLFDEQLNGLSLNTSGKIIKSYPDYVKLTNFNGLREDEVILFAGFPIYRKGLDVLISAFKSLLPDFNEWQLHILGWFENKPKLDELIDGCENIKHLEAVPHEQVAEFMGSCAFYAMPSRSEGMGRVFIEAARCGKPRVGTKVGGIPTVITDGVDGFLVPPDDEKALANTLRKLMESADLRKQLGEAAYQRSLDSFSESAYFENMGSFYAEVIAQKS